MCLKLHDFYKYRSGVLPLTYLFNRYAGIREEKTRIANRRKQINL